MTKIDLTLRALLVVGLGGACDPETATTGENSSDSETDGASDGGSDEGGEPACPAPTHGPTVHSGTIAAGEVWAAEDGPHVVTPWVRFAADSSLTIAACSEVRMQKDAALVVGDTNGDVTASLRAEGEPGREIRFVRDGAEPWSAIVVYDPATVVLRHVSLDGGGSDRFLYNASLVLRGDGTTPTRRPLTVEAVTVRRSLGHGVVAEWVAGFTAGSTGLTVTASGSEDFPQPVRLGEHSLDSLPDGNYTGNRVDEILIDDEGANQAGGLQQDGTIHDRGVPYHVGTFPGSRLRVGAGFDSGTVTTLTIEPGVELRFEPGTSLEIEHYTSDDRPASGALVAVGTPERPIVFTSAAPARWAGDWVGLWFGGVPAAHNRIEHAVIEYAGGECGCVGFTCTEADEASVLFVESAPATDFIKDTTIRHSAGHGISRGWMGAGPDFMGSNVFEDVAGCMQTRARSEDSSCYADGGCG